MFDPTIKLETPRFLLRKLEKMDEEALIFYAETEPELWNFALVQTAGRANMIRYIDDALEQHAQGTVYPFVVIEKASGQIVGSTRYYDIQLKNGSTQLGYTWYSKHQQGNGINAHCKFLLLQYAFETLQLERVEFRADARNYRSVAAMRKIGCTEEGVLRSHLPIADGSRRDSVVLSILKPEWEERVKGLLTGMVDGEF